MPLHAQSYLEDHVFYSSSFSDERAITVALPNDYKQNIQTYPVLYVLDGEYIFNYAKGMVDFLTNKF